MDTQTNCSILIKNGQNRDIDIDLYVAKDNELLFEIDEYETILITFSSDILDSTIKIEDYTTEDWIQLSNKECKEFNNFTEGNSYVPGRYTVILLEGNNKKSFLFQVNPASIEWDHLNDLKHVLESFSVNLSKDLYSRKKFGVDLDNSTIHAITFFEYLLESQDVLITYLSLIFENPLSELVKKYDFHYESRKPDNKTFKNYARKSINPALIHYGKEHYESRCYLDIKIPENAWLAKIILNLQKHIISFSQVLRNELSRLKDYITACELEIETADNLLKKYKYNKTISIGYLRNLEMKKINNQQQIVKVENLMENLKQYDSSSRMLNTIIERCRETSIIFDNPNYHRPLKNYKKIHKDFRYHWMYEFMNNIENSITHNLYGKKSFSSKSTWLLFEQFVVVLLIQILIDEEYTWESGWMADDNYNDFGVLSGNTKLIFSNCDSRLIFYYDTELLPDRSKKSSFFIPRESGSRRPDCLLALFDNNGMFKDAIVFEVKCRKSYNIYNRNYPTKVFDQLLDYKRLDFYSNVDNKVRSGIDKVVTIYPFQSGLIDSKDDIYSDQIAFLPLKVSKDIELNDSVQKLKKILCDFLNKDIVSLPE